ncbi:unknown [Eubacterium sp. CAG:146]|nr:unknown [Eubacterium sp. CAG:146]
MVISELSEEEELEFINVYLEAYLNNVADDDTKVKYSSVLPDTADQIYSNFKTALKEECDRPLFVAVYTELWIYKDGCISVTSLDEMLAAFLKREEDRWLLCLDNHSNLLKDYGDCEKIVV